MDTWQVVIFFGILELSSRHIITISYDIEKLPFENLGNIFSHSNGRKMSNVSRLYMIMSTCTYDGAAIS